MPVLVNSVNALFWRLRYVRLDIPLPVKVVSFAVLVNDIDVSGVLSRWSSLRALRLCPLGLNDERVVLLLRLIY